MKERPILFNGEMVRAILAGQKTQTRRPIPVYPDAFDGLRREIHDGQVHFWASGAELPTHKFSCPHGQPGDRLWVRETFCTFEQSNGSQGVAYCADTEDGWYSPCETLTGGYPSHCSCHPGCEGCTAGRWKPTWRPSIHMPRWASRITLEITDVREERVQNITSDGAIAEGAYEVRKVGDDIAHATWTMDGLDWRYDTPREAFAATWDSLYAARGLGWNVNPLVWVVTFKRAENQKCPKN